MALVTSSSTSTNCWPFNSARPPRPRSRSSSSCALCACTCERPYTILNPQDPPPLRLLIDIGYLTSLLNHTNLMQLLV
jgi:hypothetical protein